MAEGRREREAVIVDTVRTAFGRRGGALANWHPVDLLAFTLQNLVSAPVWIPAQIDDVIGGCVQPGRRAVDECGHERLGGGRPSPARARRRPSTVSAVRHSRPCTSPLRRHRRPLRPGDRLRCRVDEQGPARVQRPRRNGTLPARRISR